MDELTRLGIVGGVVGGVAAVLAILALDLLKPRRFCPDCRNPLPKLRRLKNRRQRLFGGWTCPRCRCEIDREGKKVAVSV